MKKFHSVKDFRLGIQKKSTRMSIRALLQAAFKHHSRKLKNERKWMTLFMMINALPSKKVTWRVNSKKTVKISMKMNPAQVTATPLNEDQIHLARRLEEQSTPKMEKQKKRRKK